MDAYKLPGTSAPADQWQCLNVISSRLTCLNSQGSEDGRVSGRINTKVSKIATMFQSVDEPSFSFEESKIRDVNVKDVDIPKNPSVVRTESHVARFNNAKAMFEKMSGNTRKEGKMSDTSSKISDSVQKICDVSINTAGNGRQGVSRISSQSPTGIAMRNGTSYSRSPSPGAVNGRKSNGHITIMPSVATISSSAISPPLSPAPSLISPSNSSPVPRSLTSSCRTLSASSSDSGDYTRRKEEDLDIKKGKDSNSISNIGATNLSSNKDPSLLTTDNSFIFHCSSLQHTAKSHSSKPNKPTKPDALKNVGYRSSHDHHHELMQRHKNWFQSYSRAKSPSSPAKSDSDRALSPDNNLITRKYYTSNQEATPNKVTNSSDEKCGKDVHTKTKTSKSKTDKSELVKSFFAGGQSDLVKEKAALFSSRQNSKANTSKSVDAKTDNFETSSTLPSKWCPPKQYIDSKPLKSLDHSSVPINKDTSSSSYNSGDAESVSMPGQLDAATTSQVHTAQVTSLSVDDLDRAEENNVTFRRRGQHGENSFRRMVSSENSLCRHSFHREPEHTVVREVPQTRRFSSLECDKERRLKEWERKKVDREKRHSEGNLSNYFKDDIFSQEKYTIPPTKGNISDRIKKYEDKIFIKNPNQYHSSIELGSKNHRNSEDDLMSCRLKQDSPTCNNKELMESNAKIDLKEKRRSSIEERKQKEIYEIECKRKEHEEYELKRRELEENERKCKEWESIERRQKEQEETEKIRMEQSIDRKRREKENMERRIQEQEEIEKRKRDQEMERKLKEERELERRRKEKEEIDQRRKEHGERERILKENLEFERRLKEQEEMERRQREITRIKREQQDKEIRIKKQELERLRKEQEEIERRRKEKEQMERDQKEKEMEQRKREVERKRMEEEEIERKRGEREEKEQAKRAKEELERIKHEQELEQLRHEQEMERLRNEQEMERLIKEQERERVRKEQEMERLIKEQEKERVRKEQERERVRREEERERVRKEQERERIRQVEEKDRIRKEREKEQLRKQHEKLQKERELARICEEKEKIERHRKEKEIEKIRKEQEERNRKEQAEIERKRIVKEEMELVRNEQEIERNRRYSEQIDRRLREQKELVCKQRDLEEKERTKLEQLEMELNINEQQEMEYILKERENLENIQKDNEQLVQRQKEAVDFDRKIMEEQIDNARRQHQNQRHLANLERQEDSNGGDISNKNDDRGIRTISSEVRSGLSYDDKIELGIERRRMQRKNEELFRQIEEEKEQERWKCIQDEIQRKKEEVQQKLDMYSENISASSQHQTLDSSGSSTALTQSDEEDRKRREKDREEIMKTKQRIAELKREREEIRKQQVAQMQRLLSSPDVGQMNAATSSREDNDDASVKLSTTKHSTNENFVKSLDSLHDAKEEIFYDHTVLSAQHKIELCGSPIGTEPAKNDDIACREPPYYKYPTSTISSVEALPPPIPPHNVDPASLIHTEQEAEDRNVTEVQPTLEGPDVMTPEEQQKLLSVNHSRSLLSDAEATEARLLLDQSEDEILDDPKTVTRNSHDSKADQLAQREELNKPSLTSSEKEANDEVFISRVQEVMEEDGVHYLEDGHFWIEIPGINDTDDEIFDPEIPFHKSTKLKFSPKPIRLFSTHSVSDYDRKNDDVDPVAASAEYELEKRVEKMDVFPVQIQKGESGLGLSIIGMGVGADAGVEKLGIFVKTITSGGPTEADGRIQVNDQIIEVDSKSLVGVTQIFAATVLKNTSGLVHFLIGREKDPESSEVAVLIRQSLQADREREERRRALEGPDFDPNNSGVFFDSLSSASDDLSPMEAGCSRFEHYDDLNEGRLIDKDGSEETEPTVKEGYDHHDGSNTLASSEIMLLRHHLQEAQQTNEMYEEELNILRSKLNELEREVADKDEMTVRFNDVTKKLQDAEEKLQTRLAETATYQDMLEQSQGQYIILEKKYFKAKKIIKEYQTRERDFLHREDYHISQLEEKDSHYNSLVKALKDRVIQLEGDLMRAQKTAGLAVQITTAGSSVLNLPTHSESNAKLTDPPKLPQTLKCLDADISDTEAGEGATSEESRSSTVERKGSSNEDLDSVVPHSLLDVSASKAKGELASRGGLANRHLPSSLKKSSSQSSTGSFDRNRDDSLEESFLAVTSSSSVIYEHSTTESDTTNSSLMLNSSSQFNQEVFQTSSYYTALSSTGQSHSSHLPSSTPRAPPPYHPPPSAPLTQRPLSQSEWGIPGGFSYERSDIPYRHAPPIARVQPVNRVDAMETIAVGTTQSIAMETKSDHQLRLADQLKAVLAERESSTEVASASTGAPIKKSLSNLMEDVRQAVIQADVSLGKKPSISGPIQFPSLNSECVQKSASAQRISSNSLQQRLNRDSWSSQFQSSTPANLVQNKSDSGVVLLSKKPIDSSLSPIKNLDESQENLSMSSFDSFNRSALDTSGQVTPVCDWSKEQVAHWLMIHGLESCISKFLTSEITGPRLINLDAKDLKNLSLSNDEKNKIKKKVKDLRLNIEKEKKQADKEKKEKEKLLKKAEKLAEKAEKRRR